MSDYVGVVVDEIAGFSESSAVPGALYLYHFQLGGFPIWISWLFGNSATFLLRSVSKVLSAPSTVLSSSGGKSVLIVIGRP